MRRYLVSCRINRPNQLRKPGSHPPQAEKSSAGTVSFQRFKDRVSDLRKPDGQLIPVVSLKLPVPAKNVEPLLKVKAQYVQVCSHIFL
jgi:hypothetical protein